MSNTNNYKSTGTLFLKGKKLRGTMVAEERLATFTGKGKTIEMPYADIAVLKNERNGGMSSTITVKMKDETEYVFYLSNGLKVYHRMDELWDNKPRIRSKADELHRLAEMRGERIVKPRKRLVKRRRPNRSLGGDLGIYFMQWPA